jgi:hypothetical protein
MKEYSHKSQEFDYAVEKLEEVDDSVLQEQWNHVTPAPPVQKKWNASCGLFLILSVTK